MPTRITDQQLKRKKRIRFIVIPILTLIVLLALVLFKRFYLDTPSAFEKGDIVLHGPYKVERVVDGDTFTVKMDGKSEKVRLIGVDAPESVAPSTYGKPNTSAGEKASKYLEKLISGKNVYLEYDLNYMDKYSRVLAYVFLSDQKTMVQEVLLKEGYVQIMTVQPNVKYQDYFYNLQKAARNANKGFWKTNEFMK